MEGSNISGRLIESENDVSLGQIMFRLKRGKSTDLKQTRQHECSHELCHPQNEEYFVYSKKILTGPVLSSNVYLCDFGCIHICSVTSCQLYGYSLTQTCPLSGLQWGLCTANYDRNDFRTWKGGGVVETHTNGEHLQKILLDVVLDTDKEAVEKEKEEEEIVFKKRRIVKQNSISVLLEKARTLVETLLFSSYRRTCNVKSLSVLQKNAAHAKQTYVASRKSKRQLPYLTDLIRLAGSYMQRPLPLLEVPRCHYTIEYYAHAVMTVWNHIVSYCEKEIDAQSGDEILPRFNFDTVVIGVLYSMRSGVIMGDVQILPEDAFLKELLPEIRDLNFFSIEKRAVTQGCQLVTTTYRRAIGLHGILANQLVLDTVSLPHASEKLVIKE